MKTILRNASRATQPVYDIVSGLFTGPGAIGLAFLPLVLGVTTTAFLGVVATETGRAILDGIRRHRDLILGIAYALTLISLSCPSFFVTAPRLDLPVDPLLRFLFRLCFRFFLRFFLLLRAFLRDALRLRR